MQMQIYKNITMSKFIWIQVYMSMDVDQVVHKLDCVYALVYVDVEALHVYLNLFMFQSSRYQLIELFKNYAFVHVNVEINVIYMIFVHVYVHARRHA